jgi:hypothetical protein
MRKPLHFVGMQAAWFAAALLASTPFHLLGALANVAFVAVHVALSGRARAELLRAGQALALGLGVELIDTHVGHVVAQHSGVLPAPWLLSLWPAFASSFMEGNSLAWLRGRTGTAALLGAVLGPVGYFGGARLGAVEIEGVRSALCLSATWAVAMAVLAQLGAPRRP